MAAQPTKDPAGGHKLGPKGSASVYERLSDRHGLIFDLTALVGWAALGTGIIHLSALDEALGTLRSGFQSGPLPAATQHLIGYLLVGGIATQIIGSILKGPSLRYRLRLGSPAISPGWLGFFWFLHFLFFLVATTFCLAMLGWLPPSGDTGFPTMLLVFGVGGGTTLVVKAAATPSKREAAPPPGIEIVGTEILSISALVLGIVFWEPMAGWMMSNSVKIEPTLLNLLGRVVVVGCQVILFMVFYIPARLLFLVEDARRPSTWIRFSVVLLPLAWHILTT